MEKEQGIPLGTSSFANNIGLLRKFVQNDSGQRICSGFFGSYRIRDVETEGEFLMSSLMLVGAMLASLALGVLLAYGLCQIIFHLFLIHSQSAARRMGTARIRVKAES
jgi:hypothetical protein